MSDLEFLAQIDKMKTLDREDLNVCTCQFFQICTKD